MANPLGNEVGHLIRLTKMFLILVPILLFCAQSIWGGGKTMEILSSAFKDQGKIPIQYVMPGAGGKEYFHTTYLEKYTFRDKVFCLIDC